MPKEAAVEAKGVVEKLLPGTQFQVKLNGHDKTILAYASGKIRKHHIRILLGDEVLVEMSPYDLTKGRITFRYK